MAVSRQDRDVLRELAGQVAEIASLPVQQETISLWKALNGLKPVRPMVMIDQIPWHEMECGDELALQTEDAFCRDVETTLRRTLYSWKHMRADMVVEPVVEIPKVIRGEGFGIQTVERIAITDPRNDVVGHAYVDQLETEEDLRKIRQPEISLDAEATSEVEYKAREIFDGVLTVRMQGRFPTPADGPMVQCTAQLGGLRSRLRASDPSLTGTRYWAQRSQAVRRCRSGREEEMVALFLRTEISTERYRARLLECLRQADLPESIITEPDLADTAENCARRELLGRYRGYGRDEDYFQGFPADLRWEWEALTPEELVGVKYIDYDYWVELSGGSRLPTDAIPRIHAGAASFGVSSEWAPRLADAIAAGADIPPLILVAPHEEGQMVVLEGHARLTAYLLRPQVLPTELLVLVGYSPEIVCWGLY